MNKDHFDEREIAMNPRSVTVAVVSLLLLLLSQSGNAQLPPQMGEPFRPNLELYRIDRLASQGGVSYSGDLSLSIPLLTVPGRHGHGFPIVLTYSNNISQRQMASWVGLGWNLDLGSVERTVSGRYDEQAGETEDDHHGGQRAELVGWLHPNHSSLSIDEQDHPDIFSLNIDGSGEELLPYYDNGVARFVASRYKFWSIYANFNWMAMETGVLPRFDVLKEDGSWYVYSGAYTAELRDMRCTPLAGQFSAKL